MILEFADGSSIEVRDIFGMPALINGVVRDTLKIEVDPSTISFEDLKSHFKNNPKTAALYTYVDNNGEQVKTEIGIGYTIYTSITDETRKIPIPAGKLEPDRFEDIYIVQISQQTYQESLLSSQ